MKWNIPILLTWLRVWLIPVFTILFYLPNDWIDYHTVNWLGALIFSIAAITDGLTAIWRANGTKPQASGLFLIPLPIN